MTAHPPCSLSTRRCKSDTSTSPPQLCRGAKKLVLGTGNAAWVLGTTMLVMVMPLVFEIDREQQQIEMETMQGIQGGAMKL